MGTVMGDHREMCKNQPLVSIIMPVYNCEKYLPESIESVISQSYQNWELIIVDDGSNDRSILIIESYAERDSRIRLYKNESGEHGPGIARNYGIEQISGKYTYFIDADDWIEKDLLQDTVTLAEETGADIVPFGYLIEDNGETIKNHWFQVEILNMRISKTLQMKLYGELGRNVMSLLKVSYCKMYGIINTKLAKISAFKWIYYAMSEKFAELIKNIIITGS